MKLTTSWVFWGLQKHHPLVMATHYCNSNITSHISFIIYRTNNLTQHHREDINTLGKTPQTSLNLTKKNEHFHIRKK